MPKLKSLNEARFDVSGIRTQDIDKSKPAKVEPRHKVPKMDRVSGSPPQDEDVPAITPPVASEKPQTQDVERKPGSAFYTTKKYSPEAIKFYLIDFPEVKGVNPQELLKTYGYINDWPRGIQQKLFEAAGVENLEQFEDKTIDLKKAFVSLTPNNVDYLREKIQELYNKAQPTDTGREEQKQLEKKATELYAKIQDYINRYKAQPSNWSDEEIEEASKGLGINPYADNRTYEELVGFIVDYYVERIKYDKLIRLIRPIDGLMRKRFKSEAKSKTPEELIEFIVNDYFEKVTDFSTKIEPISELIKLELEQEDINSTYEELLESNPDTIKNAAIEVVTRILTEYYNKNNESFKEHQEAMTAILKDIGSVVGKPAALGIAKRQKGRLDYTYDQSDYKDLLDSDPDAVKNAVRNTLSIIFEDYYNKINRLRQPQTEAIRNILEDMSVMLGDQVENGIKTHDAELLKRVCNALDKSKGKKNWISRYINIINDKNINTSKPTHLRAVEKQLGGVPYLDAKETKREKEIIQYYVNNTGKNPSKWSPDRIMKVARELGIKRPKPEFIKDMENQLRNTWSEMPPEELETKIIQHGSQAIDKAQQALDIDDDEIGDHLLDILVNMEMNDVNSWDEKELERFYNSIDKYSKGQITKIKGAIDYSDSVPEPDESMPPKQKPKPEINPLALYITQKELGEGFNYKTVEGDVELILAKLKEEFKEKFKEDVVPMYYGYLDIVKKLGETVEAFPEATPEEILETAELEENPQNKEIINILKQK